MEYKALPLSNKPKKSSGNRESFFFINVLFTETLINESDLLIFKQTSVAITPSLSPAKPLIFSFRFRFFHQIKIGN